MHESSVKSQKKNQRLEKESSLRTSGNWKHKGGARGVEVEAGRRSVWRISTKYRVGSFVNK